MTPRRPLQLLFRGNALRLPAFFPSVSSAIKTDIRTIEFIKILVVAEEPRFLVSAYDYDNASPEDASAFQLLVEKASSARQTVLLDSGQYESYWKHDSKWTCEQFRVACAHLNPAAAFCFDEQYPPSDTDDAARAVVENITADQRFFRTTTILPIVHGASQTLPGVVSKVVKHLHPLMVAVPERELGDGLRARCCTMRRIRDVLDSLDYYCPVHVLGTGNPHAIMALTISGADSFDGLEWCQTVADFETGQLSHFQHWDIVSSTSPVRDSKDFPYHHRTLAHNLIFFRNFMEDLKEYVINDNASDVIRTILKRLQPVLEPIPNVE